MNNIGLILILIISLYLIYFINNKKQSNIKIIDNNLSDIYINSDNSNLNNYTLNNENLNNTHFNNNNLNNNNLDNHNNKNISYMMYPQCNLLVGDHGKTCRQTKGCYYDNNGCHHDWKHIY